MKLDKEEIQDSKQWFKILYKEIKNALESEDHYEIECAYNAIVCIREQVRLQATLRSLSALTILRFPDHPKVKQSQIHPIYMSDEKI